MALLIADVGGTKSSWFLSDQLSGKQFSGPGFNPFSNDEYSLGQMMDQLEREIERDLTLDVRYYGAGATSDQWKYGIEQAFRTRFRISSLQVESDLLGAAHSLCGQDAGLVGILGTGSNLCLYDGSEIVWQISSLGYPLGDEGSGTHIGKLLVRAYYYGHLSSECQQVCRAILPQDRNKFLDLYQRAPKKNSFLASLTPHIHKNLHLPEFKQIVRSSFRSFVDAHVRHHKPGQKINFTGSIAFYFCDELQSVLSDYDFELGTVIKEPMINLIEFYKRNKKQN